MHSRVRASTLRAALRGHAAYDVDRAQRDATAALQRLYPSRAILLTDSGTSALRLALDFALQRASGASDGRAGRAVSVALPAYACPDVATAAIGAGFRIRLYDVDPRSLNPDFDSLAACLQDGVSIVVATHLFGFVVDIDAMARLAASHDAIVIEDAAQHAGGSRRGTRGGALADWSVLSFGRGKGINAGGGGALLQPASKAERHPEIAAAARGQSSKVLLKAALAEFLSHPLAYGVPASIPALGLGETNYHEPQEPGAMTLASMHLLIGALHDEEAALGARRQVDQWYREQLADARHALPTPDVECEPGGLRTPIRLHGALSKNLARLGVARSYPRTLADYPEVRPYIDGDVDAPGARSLARTLHTLPTHALLPPSERVRLVSLLRAAVAE